MRKPQETVGILGDFLLEVLDGDIILEYREQTKRLGLEEVCKGKVRKGKHRP